MAAPAGGRGQTPDTSASAVPDYGVPSATQETDREDQPILSRLPSLPDGVSAKLNRLKGRLPTFGSSDRAAYGGGGYGSGFGGSDAGGQELPPVPASPAKKARARGGAGSASPWSQPPPPGSAPGRGGSAVGGRPARRSARGTRSGGQDAVDTRTERQYGSGGQPQLRNGNYQPRRRVGQEALGGHQAPFDSNGASAAVVPVPGGGFRRPSGRATSVPPAAPRPSGRQYPRRVRGGTVVERRVLRRLDTWTVFKVSMLFYLCVAIIMLLAGIVLWNVAAGSGTLNNVDKFIRTLFDLKTFALHPHTMLRWFAVVAGLVVLAGTFINVLASLIYNLISDVVGGIQIIELGEPD